MVGGFFGVFLGDDLYGGPEESVVIPAGTQGANRLVGLVFLQFARLHVKHLQGVPRGVKSTPRREVHQQVHHRNAESQRHSTH